jgi:hypothetical protein
MWFFAIALLISFWKSRGCGKTNEPTPEQLKERAEFQAEIERIDAKNKHPKADAAFKIGFEFAARNKASGMAKPTDQELDAYGLKVCEDLGVPDDIRGAALRKFKSGYGWGWRQAQ